MSTALKIGLGILIGFLLIALAVLFMSVCTAVCIGTAIKSGGIPTPVPAGVVSKSKPVPTPTSTGQPISTAIQTPARVPIPVPLLVPTAKPPSTPTPRPARPGDPVLIGGFEVVLTGFEFADASSLFVNRDNPQGKAPPGAKILWVHMRMTNITEVKRGLGIWTDHYVIYKDSKERLSTSGDKTHKGIQLYGEIFPGVSVEGWLYATVPVAAQPEHLAIRFATWWLPEKGREEYEWRFMGQ